MKLCQTVRSFDWNYHSKVARSIDGDAALEPHLHVELLLPVGERFQPQHFASKPLGGVLFVDTSNVVAQILIERSRNLLKLLSPNSKDRPPPHHHLHAPPQQR